MTEESKFWFVVKKLGDAGKTIPLPALRAIQLINNDRIEALQHECEQLRLRVSELERRQSEIEISIARRFQRRDEILGVLQQCQGDIEQACSRLGINRSTIYRNIPRLRHVLKSRFVQSNEARDTGQVQSNTVQA